MIFLVLLFIVLPIAELYVIIQVGDLIGIWPTLALLLLDGVLGAILLRSQGRSAWRRFQEALARSRMPVKEVYDGAAIIFGAALLMTPGFITDVFGFLLLIPPTRAALRRFLLAIAWRVGPARSVLFLYDRRPAGWRRDSRTGPGGTDAGADSNRPRPPGRDYDFDGNAREIPVDGPELDRGEGR
ncbi:MAG TPA: FxsA family protein [Solirubrobacterales bacterium]|nr:FxsA family protein [Solirubrobacterales bacterium]